MKCKSLNFIFKTYRICIYFFLKLLYIYIHICTITYSFVSLLWFGGIYGCNGANFISTIKIAALLSLSLSLSLCLCIYHSFYLYMDLSLFLSIHLFIFLYCNLFLYKLLSVSRFLSWLNMDPDLNLQKKSVFVGFRIRVCSTHDEGKNLLENEISNLRLLSICKNISNNQFHSTRYHLI